MPFKGFFDFPRNVRDAIYVTLFTKPKPIDLATTSPDPKNERNTSQSNPRGRGALLLCSTRVCREGTKVLYGTNKFIVKNRELYFLLEFLQTIGAHNCTNIRLIRIHLNKRKTTSGELATISLFTRCCVLLKNTFLDKLELHLERGGWKLIENHMLMLKASTLVVRMGPETRPSPEVIRNLWCSKFLAIFRADLGVKRWLDGQQMHGPRYKSPFDANHWIIDQQLRHYELGGSHDYFSALPPEVRNLIYDILFVQDTEIRPLDYSECPHNDARSHPQASINATIWKAMGLLHVSKKIHKEVTSVLYGCNVFRLLSCESGDIPAWLVNIGLENRMKIKYLQIDPDHVLRQLCGAPMPDAYFDMSMPNRPITQVLEDAMSKSIIIMEQAFDKAVEDASEAAIKTYLDSLPLLAACRHLSRLELRVPFVHCIVREEEPMIVDCGHSWEAYDATCAVLVDLHVSTEMRIGYNCATDELGFLMNEMGVQQMVVFSSDGYEAVAPAPDESEDEELGELQGHWGWEPSACGKESRLGTAPKSLNKLEKRMSKIWPQAHDTICHAEHTSHF